MFYKTIVINGVKKTIKVSDPGVSNFYGGSHFHKIDGYQYKK
jgi:hypothetical protein